MCGTIKERKLSTEAITAHSDSQIAGAGDRSPGGRPIEPIDAAISSIQPGGGVGMRCELAWGYVRRWLLKTLRPGYVARMRATRRGDHNACPHEVLDPRDVKFFRNQGGYYWLPEDDPFAWRDRLPFVRAGLAELILLGGGFFLMSGIFAVVFWPLAIVTAALGLEVVWFFRNPRRQPPPEPGLIVAPADGRVVAVEEIHDEFIGGAAWRIDIFLSVFNVHVNRVPCDVRVLGLRYRRGKFLNALRAEASRENEQMELRLEEASAPYRPLIVRQIVGAIARRIVCWVAPGAVLRRGEALGMIKLGSRTELVLAKAPGLEILAGVGQKVRAGVSVLARYPAASTETGA
jgi:phosphatidylserine decarboxylase